MAGSQAGIILGGIFNALSLSAGAQSEMSRINLSGYLSLSWIKNRFIPSALIEGRIRKSPAPSMGLTAPSA